jgi:hypothetical protein
MEIADLKAGFLGELAAGGLFSCFAKPLRAARQAPSAFCGGAATFYQQHAHNVWVAA